MVSFLYIGKTPNRVVFTRKLEQFFQGTVSLALLRALKPDFVLILFVCNSDLDRDPFRGVGEVMYLPPL